MGTEFYRRSRFDVGEIRIFLNNSGHEPVSVCRPEFNRLLDIKDDESYKSGIEVGYLYSKLSPPVLMPGRNGELLVKLLESPPDNSKFKCNIYGEMDWLSETIISIKEAPVWISYVGFSQDLGKIYVYGQNNAKIPLKIKLIEVAGIKVGDNYQPINSCLQPGDKGCLVFKMPSRPTLGEYVRIAISAKSNEREFQTSKIIRAVNKFPLSSGGGSFIPRLGLDSGHAFVQTMSCPAHAHGTSKEAARKFIDDCYRRFLQDPYFLSKMWICRARRPRAWYTFGALPDSAVINPVLLVSQTYQSNEKASEQFCPFFWLATNAKKALEPNRFFACIPVNPDDSVFSQSNHTPDEIKFLVYCAVSAGAKGILYRDTPSFSRLGEDKFVRLNRELRQLKPLLMIAESVNWASTADDNYVARSLLCGDEAILVIVFDCRYFSEQQNRKLRTPAFGKALRVVKTRVKVPEGFSVMEVQSMYAPLSTKRWRMEKGRLDFQADMVDSVQVYKAVLKCKSSMSGVKE
ncbi:MAG: hypothetical protein GWN00_00965 [Aliifodinibius sp.]|nr:hypothetical protein [Phycisphaerae bacterium]NIT54847.1 hypothetical protein [Fodinibius sp.]NIV09902.1 hypothetical protein [Fodinibius sp.]NIY23431.1 hypothetical protein [Fodinibius sp.]